MNRFRRRVTTCKCAAQMRSTAFARILRGVRVADIMVNECATIDASVPVRTPVDRARSSSPEFADLLPDRSRQLRRDNARPSGRQAPQEHGRQRIDFSDLVQVNVEVRVL